MCTTWVGEKEMNMHRQLIIVLLFLTSFTINAVEPNPAGQLAVIVALSDSPQYLKTWISTAPEKAAPIPRLRELRPEQVGYAAFIITGIEGDENGKFSYSVSWRLIGPSGQLVYAYSNYAKGSGKIHHQASFYMADPALDIILENNDPSGEYILEATAIDLINGKSASISYNIHFRKPNAA